MSYLAWSGGGQKEITGKGTGGRDARIAQLADRVLRANPVLESFGNAVSDAASDAAFSG